VHPEIPPRRIRSGIFGSVAALEAAIIG